MIEVKDLSYTYDKNVKNSPHAINGVSFSVSDGEFIGIIGATGSGKSTLIQHLNGLIKPDRGAVFVDGEDINQTKKKKLRKLRFDVGLVFQYPEYQLFEETVERDIAFGPKNMGLSEDEIAQRVRHAAELVGLTPNILSKSPFDLSGGEKRKAAIAGVLAMKPKVLILDEPAAGLDPVSRRAILNAVKALHKAEGITVLLVSHNMDDVAELSDRIMVLANGTLVAFDTPQVIFEDENVQKLGLSLPMPAQLCNMLRGAGISLMRGIFTLEQAKNEIIKASNS
jgi:ABC-type cobalt transport system, ATPase component